MYAGKILWVCIHLGNRSAEEQSKNVLSPEK